jgi:hypothetical protein
MDACYAWCTNVLRFWLAEGSIVRRHQEGRMMHKIIICGDTSIAAGLQALRLE